MKKVLKTLFVLVFVLLFPLNVYADQTDNPVPPVIIDENVVHNASNSASYHFTFPMGFQRVTVNGYGSIEYDSNGQIVNCYIDAYSFIGDGEGYPSASTWLTNVQVTSHGTYVTLSYKVYVSAGGITKSTNGSMNLS